MIDAVASLISRQLDLIDLAESAPTPPKMGINRDEVLECGDGAC